MLKQEKEYRLGEEKASMDTTHSETIGMSYTIVELAPSLRDSQP